VLSPGGTDAYIVATDTYIAAPERRGDGQISGTKVLQNLKLVVLKYIAAPDIYSSSRHIYSSSRHIYGSCRHIDTSS